RWAGHALAQFAPAGAGEKRVRSALPDGTSRRASALELLKALARPRRSQVRTTGNPAFRNLPTSGGYGSYATFDTRSGAGHGYQAPPTAVERPMTIDDVVTKTAVTL